MLVSMRCDAIVMRFLRNAESVFVEYSVLKV